MKTTIISIDFDEVLVDSQIVTSVVKESGLNLTPTNYGFSDYPAHVREEILWRFSDPNSNKNPVVLPGAAETVSQLTQMGFKVIVVTARPHSVAEVTKKTVTSFFPSVSDVHFTSGSLKGAILKDIGASVHIDDHHKHIDDAILHGINVPILVSNHETCWNHTAAKDYENSRLAHVISSVKEVPSILRLLGVKPK